MSSIDGKSTEDTKTFPYVTDVITLIRNSGLRLKVWDYISAAKEALPKIMAQVVSANLKISVQNQKIYQTYCSRRSPFLIHSSLYRAIKS